MYILIMQFKNKIKAVCHYYFSLTGRQGYDLTLSAKIISLIFSTFDNILKIVMVLSHREVGMIYVGLSHARCTSSSAVCPCTISSLLVFSTSWA